VKFVIFPEDVTKKYYKTTTKNSSFPESVLLLQKFHELFKNHLLKGLNI
jgi:hypothetical protein